MLSINDAISQYAGGDDAYALKLKEGIKNTMGYSNYKAKLTGAIEAPLNIGDVSNLDPAAMARTRASQAGIKQENIAGYTQMTNAIDTTAGSLASAQAAREKAAASARKENPLAFEAGDWLDKQIKEFANNRPKKEDGTYLTIDEFKKQLFGKIIGEGDAANTLFQPGLDANVINKRIEERLPSDFQDKTAYYQALSLGRTKNEATDLQNYEDYKNGKMPEGVKKMHETLNPSWEKESETKMSEDNVKKMALENKVLSSGEQVPVPANNFQKIVASNPQLQEKDIANIVLNTRKSEVQSDIKNRVIDGMTDAIRTAVEEDALGEFFTTDAYVKARKNILLANKGYLTADDVDSFTYDMILNIK